MTDRERLVELIRNETCLNNGCNFICEECDFFMLNDKDVDRLADYILADGWMRPPCKVGTHIWVIPTTENGFTEITEMAVRGFSIGEPYNVANCFRLRGTSALFQPSFEKFGKTVFLTREDAEKALNGGGEGC